MKKSTFFIHLLLLFLVSCEEKVNKPVFFTLESTDLNTEGVTLNGQFKIKGDQDINDFGFVWAAHSAPEISDKTFSFNESPAGKFQHRVMDGLITGTKYYVRTFINSNGQIYYGNTVDFVARGSATPVISGFDPTSGGSRETVTLIGNHFGNDMKSLSVKIGQNTGKVTSLSKDTIIFQLPADYITGSYPIRLEVADKEISSSQNFTLNGPIIQSLSPSSGPAGTIITISGSGFSSTPTLNIIYFDDKKAIVTSSTETEIQLTVPNNSVAGPKQVSLEFNRGKTFSAVPFSLTGPVITSFTPGSGVEGTQVTINGSGFSTIPGENIVKFYAFTNQVSGTVLSATPNQLIVEVGRVYYSGNQTQLSSPISVEVKSIYAASQNSFTFEGPTITEISPAAQYEGRIIIIQGNNFDPDGNNQVFFSNKEGEIISSTATSITVKVPYGDFGLLPSTPLSIKSKNYRYHPDQKYNILSPWRKLADFPAGPRYGVSTFTIGSYSYVCMGINAGDKVDVWRFDSSNRSWQRMADFPGQSRAFAFSFVVNGKGYVGGGGHYGYTDYDLISNLYDLWEYDPSADSWTQKRSFPSTGGLRFQATGIGDNGYFAVQNKIYKYSPSSDQWTVTTTSMSFSAGGIAATVGSKGYFGLGINNSSLWEFDPISENWNLLAPSPLLLSSFWGRLTSFTMHDKIFVGSTNKFVKYNPASNSWTQEPNIPIELSHKGAFGSSTLGYMISGLNGYPFPTFYSFDPNY